MLTDPSGDLRASSSSHHSMLSKRSRVPGFLVALRLGNVRALLFQDCFKDACKIAIPSALLGLLLKVLDHNLEYDFLSKMMPDDKVYFGFNTIMGTLLVFRTVQSLSQFREGASFAHQITGNWFDAASTLISFTRCSKADRMTTNNFQHTIVRMFSLLNMLCFAELENHDSAAAKQASIFETIDTSSIDFETLEAIRNSGCKVEVVAQLIQSMIVDAMTSGVLSVPPPIVTRAFQDLGNGLLRYHTALNIAHVDIPLPYLAITEVLLLLHAVYTPAAMCMHTQGPAGACIFTFITVLLLWSFNLLAMELTNPFGADSNDLPVQEMQYQLNERLQSLIHLSEHATPSTTLEKVAEKKASMTRVITTPYRDQPLKYTLSEFFDNVCNKAEVCQKAPSDHPHLSRHITAAALAVQADTEANATAGSCEENANSEQDVIQKEFHPPHRTRQAAHEPVLVEKVPPDDCSHQPGLLGCLSW